MWKSESLFEHKTYCRGSTLTDAKGRVRLGVGGRARARCLEANALLLLARIDRSRALEVGRAAKTVCDAAGRARCSRAIVLRAIEGFGLLLA